MSDLENFIASPEDTRLSSSLVPYLVVLRQGYAPVMALVLWKTNQGVTIALFVSIYTRDFSTYRLFSWWVGGIVRQRKKLLVTWVGSTTAQLTLQGRSVKLDSSPGNVKDRIMVSMILSL